MQLLAQHIIPITGEKVTGQDVHKLRNFQKTPLNWQRVFMEQKLLTEGIYTTVLSDMTEMRLLYLSKELISN